MWQYLYLFITYSTFVVYVYNTNIFIVIKIENEIIYGNIY